MSNNSAKGRLRLYQLIVLAVSFLLWYALTSPTLLPPIYFDDPNQAAFFFGEPQKVLGRVWDWFSSATEVAVHIASSPDLSVLRYRTLYIVEYERGPSKGPGSCRDYCLGGGLVFDLAERTGERCRGAGAWAKPEAARGRR